MTSSRCVPDALERLRDRLAAVAAVPPPTLEEIVSSDGSRLTLEISAAELRAPRRAGEPGPGDDGEDDEDDAGGGGGGGNIDPDDDEGYDDEDDDEDEEPLQCGRAADLP